MTKVIVATKTGKLDAQTENDLRKSYSQEIRIVLVTGTKASWAFNTPESLELLMLRKGHLGKVCIFGGEYFEEDIAEAKRKGHVFRVLGKITRTRVHHIATLAGEKVFATAGTTA